MVFKKGKHFKLHRTRGTIRSVSRAIPLHLRGSYRAAAAVCRVEVVSCSPPWEIVGAVWPTFLSVLSASLQHFCEQMGSSRLKGFHRSREWSPLQENITKG